MPVRYSAASFTTISDLESAELQDIIRFIREVRK